MRRAIVRSFSGAAAARGEARPLVVAAANFDVTGVTAQPVLSLVSGDAHSSVEVRKSIFARHPIRNDLLQRVVVWQLAKRRAGTAKSKNLAEVSGSTKKGAPQKGRGQARVGSKRAPQFRGGGRAFPKRPRSFDFTLPHQIRKLGLAHALSAKYGAGKLTLFAEGDQVSGKTRDLDELCRRMGWKSVLIVGGDQVPDVLERAAFNLPKVSLLSQRGINVYDILRSDHLALSIDALPYIQDQLLKDI